MRKAVKNATAKSMTGIRVLSMPEMELGDGEGELCKKPKVSQLKAGPQADKYIEALAH